MLASRGRNVIKRNMVALPAYSLLLGLLALLGYVAIAAGVKPITNKATGRPDTNTIIPVLFDSQFGVVVRRHRVRRDRDRRAGAGGDHVDRRGQPVDPQHLQGVPASATPPRRRRPSRPSSRRWWSSSARCCSSCSIDPQFSIDLQLIGGVIILQTLPAVAIALYTRWLHRWALVAGWVVGMALRASYLLYAHPEPGHGQARTSAARRWRWTS